jgi:hypothetical protein
VLATGWQVFQTRLISLFRCSTLYGKTFSNLENRHACRRTRTKTKQNIHSEIHYWADIISSSFGEKNKFGMYLGIIKRIGVARARQIFAELKESKCASPGKLFAWKASQKNLYNTDITKK